MNKVLVPQKKNLMALILNGQYTIHFAFEFGNKHLGTLMCPLPNRVCHDESIIILLLFLCFVSTLIISICQVFELLLQQLTKASAPSPAENISDSQKPRVTQTKARVERANAADKAVCRSQNIMPYTRHHTILTTVYFVTL